MENNRYILNEIARLTILLCIVAIWCVRVSASTNGIYVNESQLFVITVSDSTVILESPYWAGIQPIPNKIYCGYRHLGCGFIQISSINDYYQEATDDMRISYEKTICDDITSIKFEFPNYNDSPLVVTLYYESNKHSTICYNGNGTLNLPFDIEEFKFSLRPLIYNQYGYDKFYNGITEFQYKECIPTRHAPVIVSMPGIEYGYFDQWKINDEIIEIVDSEEIRWRNMKFIKQDSLPKGNINF